MLHEAATGVVAFQRDTLPRTLAAVTEGRSAPSEKLETLPESVREILQRVLEKDKERRFPSMHALADALGRASSSGASESHGRWAVVGAILTTALLLASYSS